MIQPLHTPFDDALRMALRPGPAPEELREGLMAAARTFDRTRRHRRIARHAIAALLLLGLGGSGFTWLRARQLPSGAEASRAALTDFMGAHTLAFQGPAEVDSRPGKDACTQWSERHVGFAAPLPAACTMDEVVGGRPCTLLGRRVAHYLLTSDRALYVFPRPLSGCGETPMPTRAIAATFEAQAWNEQGRGYVMVGPRGK